MQQISSPHPNPGQTVAQAFASLGKWAWFNSPITNYFNGTTEKGQDYSNAWGTPVGVCVGGVVKRIVHNNNSINDVVEIMDSSGAVWLYQHINTIVFVGSTLLCGDTVGIENGLPIDQYSTGPHIEVRYCPAGQWNPNTISWLEPWINPNGIFASIGNQPAGSVGSGGNPGGPPWWQVPFSWPNTVTTFNSFVSGPANLIVKPLTPGADVTQALGAIDVYMVLMNPFDQPKEPSFTIAQPSVGPISGPAITLPDPVAWIQDVGLVMVEDMGAFIVRSMLFFLGLSIMIKVISAVVDFDALGQAVKNSTPGGFLGVSPEQVMSTAGAFL